jgi:hypothetical protein
MFEGNLTGTSSVTHELKLARHDPTTCAAPSLTNVSDEELMDGLKNRDETALYEFRVRFGRVIRTIVGETLVEDYSPGGWAVGGSLAGPLSMVFHIACGRTIWESWAPKPTTSSGHVRASVDRGTGARTRVSCRF